MFETNTAHPHTNWRVLLDHIKRQKCILFLGPGAYVNHDEKIVENSLNDYLGVYEKQNPYLRKYYEDDGLFLFKKPSHKPAFITKKPATWMRKTAVCITV